MTRRNFLLASSFALPILSACSKTDFKTLKIGYLPITDHLLVIAKEFKGSDFAPVKFSSWADLSEAMQSKSIDGAFILTPLALKLKSQGLDIKALLAAHRNGSALAIKKGLLKDKDITSLKGLKIAIPSRFSTHYLLLANLLEKGNLSPKDIQIVDMAPTEMVYALTANSIDGFIVAEPFCIQAETTNVADIFTLSHNIINNHICCVLALQNDIIAQKNESITRLIGDFLATADFIHKNPKEASNLSLKFFGHKKELIENLLAQDKRVIYENLKLQESDLARTLQDIKKYEIENFNIAYDDFVDSRFIDAHLKA